MYVKIKGALRRAGRIWVMRGVTIDDTIGDTSGAARAAKREAEMGMKTDKGLERNHGGE